MQAADQSERLEKLSPAKRALLLKVLSEKAAREAGKGIPRRPGPDHAPLSFAQNRLWLIDQMDPGSTAYNVPAAVRLRGPLNGAALEQGLREVARRHEILRTVFSYSDGQPVQVVAPELVAPLPLVDLSALDERAREAEGRALAAAEARRPFDLARGPLVRTVLLRLAADEHVLLLTMHHIICDGWSDAIFVGETAALYKAYSEGAGSPLAELPIQYADYAVWQRRNLDGEGLERQLAYWRGQLAGAPPVLELPTDRPRQIDQSLRSASHSAALPEDVSVALKALARRADATLFMTLLAGLAALLGRYAGQEEVVVGSPVAGRTRGETEGLIGFFVNTLALRVDLGGDPSFAELVGRVRGVTLTAHANQDVPFERLVEELRPERSLHHSPLFQVMFDVQAAPPAAPEVPGLSMSMLPVGSKTAKFDLIVIVEESQSGELFTTVEYSTDLFERETIQRLLGHWRRLLTAAASDPGTPLSRLPLLTEDELSQLASWNETRTEYPRDLRLHELFERQAAATPDAVAVECEGGHLSYRALDRAASRLARRLRARGVGPETLVGVMLERSAEMVVALLGILKAGGAYVPLDSSYPAERLALMVEDSGARVVVTSAEWAERAEQFPGVAAVLADGVEAEARVREEPGAGVGPDSLAYVIYTSGSTGSPKGSSIPQRAVSRLVFNTNYVALDASDRVAQVSNSSFDAATFEIWGALLHGARLVIISKDVALSPEAFAEQIRGRGITTLFVTTALFNQLAGEAPTAFSSLSTLLFGGEAVDPRWVREVLRVGPPARLLHVYGPTENTTFSSWHLVGGVPERAATVAIGRPVSNSQIHLLDRHLEPVPVGVPGELYVGGEGLARNYLNRPKLTAEKFVPNPFGPEPGGRLYATGDRARYLAGGDVEFLGRLDQQVKIRGFRIEPGEIEAALSAHPGVREAVVLTREDGQGERRLIAYVAAGGGHAPTPGELRGFLRQKLPEYMSPSGIVVLKRLPLTPNGKVDRRALADSYREPGEAGVTPEAPRTPVEEVVAGVCASVLGREQIGPDDNFFELGGHSLLAARVVSRLSKAFSVSVVLRDFFDWPTVRQLSERLEEKLKGGARHETMPIERAPRGGGLPLSFSQQRVWFFHHLEPGSALYNVPVAARLRGRLNLPALEQTIAELARRHEALRTNFAATEGEPVQLISPDVPFTLACTDLDGLPHDAREASAERLAGEEARRPFDLVREPPLRVRLARLAENDHVFLLTMHHIVSDGWSLEVITREVLQLYAAFAGGGPSPLPELTFQYADYAVWQRRRMQGEALREELDYWTQRLKDAPPVLALPTDRPRPPVETHRGAREPFALSADVSQSLKVLSQREGVTLFMTLLAAWQSLLYRYTGQARISVGAPVTGRTQKELEDLVGFFVNTVVLHTDLSGDPTFRELMLRARETVLGAYAHQGLPFERLVDELQPERSLKHTPLFQAFFVFQNIPAETLELPRLKISMLGSEHRTALVDLKLAVAETPEGLLGEVEYSTDLFDRGTIRRLVGHWRRLLGAAADDPDAPLWRLPLLSPEELTQLRAWNETGAEYPRERCLHELFERQAASTPDAVAVECDGLQLSYRALNARADLLARHLRRLGVGPDSLVGVLMERSAEMVVALLGILKAGGAYVPLDPQYPAERLALMIEDSGARAVVTQDEWTGRVEQLSGVAVVRVEESRGAGPAESAGAAASDGAGAGAGPGSLAYVIYTSGSTGRPKGVCVTHGAIVNHMHWMESALPLTPDDRLLQKTSISFDASVWELFLPLWAGARLVLADGARQHESGYLVEEVIRHQVTILQLVPSMLRACLEEPSLEKCVSLRRVYSGGEALTRGVAEEFSRRLNAELHNLYGPTEASIDATHWRYDGADDGGRTTVPIGRPVSNMQAHVLDARLQQVPVGVAGELHLSGAGLARGYLRRPGLTASRFIPHPLGAEPGARLYKTGDLVRHLPGGAVEYLGRIDDQVKLRGFRIELGEVEATLRQHPEVREAVAVVREDTPGSQRLVAYVVPAPPEGETPAEGRAPSAEDLRGFLRSALPAHMVPSSFVTLESLPLAPNGKVDRRALPPPGLGREEAGQNFVAPRTETERALAAIWADVLGVERVGIHDNFFQLGGDSIQSLQIVARAGRVGLKFTTRQLFQHQTVAELATVVVAARTADVESGDATGRVPLVPAQRWFFEQEFLNPHHFNQALLFEVRRPLDAGLLGRAVAHLLAHHDALRLRFVRARAGWEARVSAAVDEACVERVDLSALPPSGQRREVEARAAEAQRGLNITSGPMLRVVLFDLGPGRPARLLIVIHHLVVDGVSWRILLEDLEAAYGQLSRGRAVELPPKTTSFKRWAEHLRERARSRALREELSYWSGVGRRGLKPLPVDRATADGENRFATARVRYATLSEAETRALLRDVPGVYRTQINDVLLTALAQVLCEWAGCRRVLIDLEGHGREEFAEGLDVSRTVGWFTSVYPVVLEVDEGGAVGATLKGVKEHLRGVPGRGVGYGLLRYMSGDEETAARLRALPRAEVSFNYLGQFDHVLSKETALAAAEESSGPPFGGEEKRWYLLDVSGSVEGGRLKMEWTYNDEAHRPETIERLAEGHLEALRSIIKHCQSPGAGGFTPSDFPLARLDARTLDRLVGGDRRVEDIYPLSPLQQGLLFHALRNPASGMYFQQMTCTIEAELDAAAFKAAWQRLLDRHTILRTSFVWEGLDDPLQVVRRGVELPWDEQDWRGLTAAEQGEALAAHLRADRARGFQLSTPPLMRLSLFRLGESVYQFTWSLHHLLIDGWSGPVLVKEVLSLYEALRRGEELTLPPPRPYSDYVAWLTRQDLSEAESYWRAALRGFDAPTRLRDELEKGDAHDGGPPEYFTRRLRLTASDTADLQRFARAHKLTVNVLARASWALLISRHSGRRDVVFGAVVSGRPEQLAGVETMVGPFINTLPVRVRIDEGEAVLDWLRGLQAQLVEMRRYEYSPLVSVQGWSEVPRGRPLFENFLNFLNYPMPANGEGERGGLKVLDFRNTERSNYPLILDAALGAELSLEITADAGRFSPQAVERMLDDLSEILRALAADGRATLGSLGGRLDEAEGRRKAERERGAREQRQRRLRETRRKAAADDE